jgi:hypothetical protein
LGLESWEGAGLEEDGPALVSIFEFSEVGVDVVDGPAFVSFLLDSGIVDEPLGVIELSVDAGAFVSVIVGVAGAVTVLLSGLGVSVAVASLLLLQPAKAKAATTVVAARNDIEIFFIEVLICLHFCIRHAKRCLIAVLLQPNEIG